MITNNENNWNNDENQNQGYTNSNDNIDDNRLDDTEGGGNTVDEDDLDDQQLDEDYDDADLTEDTDLEGTNAGYTGNINSSVDDPNEIPEEGESDNEGTGYSQTNEQNQPREGADTSYSEQIDVTPPEKHEFPSEGVATKTDFASRDLGRTTGRMVGHEPGTEGI
ncbi:hypothetical protein FPZ42_09315 [Mucilaginibacter achroorhodeus]|uniref:Uncharacterized protein n=1 Tax=Mucilaginibacter achroorhodeus TaxID=2599294 RepID=A0A563U795_9SPHI|nr:hypothetical protein [Mucilaginibacter achroorhodeus]TWR27215.1 hypothetical protein FPZ42_09315 [Mucilaginibacter achroorhodeus]